MPPSVRGLSLSLALCAVTLGGCLDRGGLDPLPDAGSDEDGGMSGGTSGGSGGARSGGTSGSGGASQTGGSSGTGGAAATGGTKGSGGASSTGGRTGSGTGGGMASGGSTGTGGVKGTGGVTGTGGKKMCGAVCDIFCPYGNVLDADGCPTCKCNPMPACPLIKCMDNCPNGYLKDEKGCDTCTCNPDPACTASDCGAMPPANTIVCPAGTAALVADPGAGAAALVAAPFVCARDASGQCVWQSRTCKVVCPIATCPTCANGFEIGPDGCQTCTCRPSTTSACGSYASAAACAADASCRWLQPGCSEPALAAAGCFAKASIGCTSDASCGMGHQCLKRVVDPCPAPRIAGAACSACAVVETICQ